MLETASRGRPANAARQQMTQTGMCEARISESVLFYTGRWDNLQTYVTPRLSYSWSSSSIEGSGSTLDATQDGWGLSGSFGAQYTLGTRFAVFAEAGLLYSSQTTETPSSFGNNERTSWTFGTRTAIGATLYF